MRELKLEWIKKLYATVRALNVRIAFRRVFIRVPAIIAIAFELVSIRARNIFR